MSPPAAPNHADLISSLSSQGAKFFNLHGVTLQSYKDLLSSYEAASGSSSRVGQLKRQLRVLKKEKSCEEGALQCHLKNLERDAEVKKRDILHVDRDEMFQTHDRLLDQLSERQCQAQVMEITLEDRTIQVVQAKLEEAELEVPASLWDEVRDDVSSPNPS
ncbi:hypothetical protein LIER_14622 [Lithospermum erythrorhizon]|uniref:Uncharacterized protein n=1 Tax=Lithospermum erythrorhizon TaxID=34254 RepID=A0AAV3PZX9_LITER